jgi:hypothetical protein
LRPDLFEEGVIVLRVSATARKAGAAIRGCQLICYLVLAGPIKAAGDLGGPATV